MFVLVIMTHGTRGDKLLGADSEFVDLMDIKDMLSPRRFPAMKGKPKFLIIQACSGGKSHLIINYKNRLKLCANLFKS